LAHPLPLSEKIISFSYNQETEDKPSANPPSFLEEKERNTFWEGKKETTPARHGSTAAIHLPLLVYPKLGQVSCWLCSGK